MLTFSIRQMEAEEEVAALLFILGFSTPSLETASSQSFRLKYQQALLKTGVLFAEGQHVGLWAGTQDRYISVGGSDLGHA